LISSYLLPSLTRQWQNHERELDIKANLVQEMSETSAEFIVAVKTYAYHGFGSGRSQEELNRDLSVARAKFDTKQAEIAAKLQAYFPQTGLSDGWNRYGNGLVSFFDTIQTGDLRFARAQLIEVEKYLGGGLNLEPLIQPSTQDAYRDALLAAQTALSAKKDVLVQQVLESDSAL
jgi:hypothetical protein